MPREHTSHSKHPFSNNTREDSTHGHQQMVNTKIRLIIFCAAKDGEALYIYIFTIKWITVLNFDICAEIAGGEWKAKEGNSWWQFFLLSVFVLDGFYVSLNIIFIALGKKYTGYYIDRTFNRNETRIQGLANNIPKTNSIWVGNWSHLSVQSRKITKVHAVPLGK